MIIDIFVIICFVISYSNLSAHLTEISVGWHIFPQCLATFFSQNTGETQKKSAQDSLEGTVVELSCDQDHNIQEDSFSL